MRKVKRPESRVQSRRAVAAGWAAFSPSGATLAEILISLMVMGIGVTSLALLISTSVLRSIQASQLTNATIHRLNAEELIGLFPRLVHDPNFDGNLAQHEVQNTGIGLDNPDNTVDGVNEGRFIVDPVGWNRAELIGVQNVFGNNGGASPANPIRRYNGGFSSAASASAAAFLADSWQMMAKGPIATAPDATSITVPVGTDLGTMNAALTASTPVIGRVVIYSRNGRQSVTRDSVTHGLTLNVGTNTVSWTGDLPAANNQYFIDADADGAYDVGETVVASRFRLETYDTRYSWLLTVRKTPGAVSGQGSAAVDVVVFHKRAFSAVAEQRFDVQSWIGPTCILNLATAPAGAKPFLKKGSYLFDAQHAHWYRVVQLKNEDTVTPEITLDRSVIAPVDTTGATVAPTHAIALPGIVDVYPIGSILFDANNAP